MTKYFPKNMKLFYKNAGKSIFFCIFAEQNLNVKLI